MVFRQVTNEELARAVFTLRNGGVVVFPTETAYGLAANATSARAVERAKAIKGREEWKTPPLIAADLQMVEKYCVISAKLRELTQQFWPGPLTIVASIPGLIPDYSRNGGLAEGVVRDGTVAIRVSSHPVAHALTVELGVPIVATSANVAGEPACYSVMDVKAQFATRPLQPDVYLDGGVLESHTPSTIVTEQNGEFIVLRQGEVDIFSKPKNC